MTLTASHPLASLLDARAIVALQDESTEQWHRQDPELGPVTTLMDVVGAQHLANFKLWHLEDEARAPGATETQIVAVKRGIDSVNQRRNDLMESCDTLLLDALRAHGLPANAAPLHSETPGLMIDRLSILALKIFHTREETLRTDASEEHVRRNQERLALLVEQRDDLADCLGQLWIDVVNGKRRFKLYRQLKMYNDPALNPAIYTRATKTRG